MKYYLAVDIGASSGRHILGSIVDGKIKLSEIHRFENGMNEKNGHLCWDSEELFRQIVLGMKKCKELGKIPESMSIDTWGVDFVLLDGDDNVIGDAVGYRDGRTDGMDESVYETVPKRELYMRTGIQRAIFNTIYQLEAIKRKNPEQLAKAQTMLMTPDYYQFRLTGVKKQEYTIASTSQLIDAESGDWDYELIDKLGYPKHIFLKPEKPGTFVGRLTDEIASEVGYNTDVVLCGSHDTASAVLSVPSVSENTLFISSGTWSLMGVELDKPNTSEAAEAANLTNEGGYAMRYRFLKNIMGLWMIQSVRKEWDKSIGYGELCEGAEKETISSVVDVDDERFLAPQSMSKEICDFCRETNQPVPNGLFELARVVYRSLAICYGKTIEQLESITGKKLDTVNIIGGGSMADYLNKLTAKYTNRKVVAGPSEATATGNLLAQMIRSGEFESVDDARKCVMSSFEVKEYIPE